MVEGAEGASQATIPLYTLSRDEGYPREPKMPFMGDWGGQSLVVDNGSYHCRVGWSKEERPRLDFRNLVMRPRVKSTGETVMIVGDYSPNEMRGFDFGRSAVRSAFEGGVVCAYDTQEMVLDHAFDRLSIGGDNVDHGIVMTEVLGNPSYCRARMLELLVETYAVPSVTLGVDSAFAYTHNRLQGRVGPDGLVVASGHSATHVYPVLGGEPNFSLASRLNVAGLHATEHLAGLLSLKYPQHAPLLAWGRPLGRPEELKEALTVCAADYLAALSDIRAECEAIAGGGAVVGGWSRGVQLPWVAAPEPAAVSAKDAAESAARKEANKAANAERLRGMAAAKRAERVAQRQSTLDALSKILELVDGAGTEERAARTLGNAGFESRDALAREVAAAAATLARAKGEEVVEVEEEAPTFPLLDVPDEQLTEEEFKEKRRQKMMKGSYEHRIKEKQRKEEERAREEDARKRDPEGYLSDLKTRHANLLARAEARRQKRLGGGGGAGAGALGEGGRRGGAEQKKRMRLLAEAAGDGKPSSKADDDFGADDKDWEVYKEMDLRNSDDEEEVEREEAELSKVAARLQEIDPSAVAPAAPVAAAPPSVLTADDFQVHLTVERIRVPEVVFQPSLLGVDQAGVGEIVASVMQRMQKRSRGRVQKGHLLLQGGNTLYEGFAARMALEVAMCCPLGAPMATVACLDPLLDAWKGAAAVASRGLAPGVTRAEVLERGAENAARILRAVKYNV